MVQDKVKELYLVVENSRRSSYIRMVSLADEELTKLPVMTSHAERRVRAELGCTNNTVRTGGSHDDRPGHPAQR